jgi:hypothetical protein
MTIVQSANPVQSRFAQRIEALDGFGRYLRPRLRGRLRIERSGEPGEPPTWSVTREDGTSVVSFGLVDTIFFWTFDDGVSNHYSRDPELLTRTVAGELARAGHLSHHAA